MTDLGQRFDHGEWLARIEAHPGDRNAVVSFLGDGRTVKKLDVNHVNVVVPGDGTHVPRDERRAERRVVRRIPRGDHQNSHGPTVPSG
ncbi:MAG: hypothetical protein DI613_13595 [Kocuria rhizophila]|nr:MAG: hypothetical protein DI613_13595 [Kocuria rhizophila]